MCVYVHVRCDYVCVHMSMSVRCDHVCVCFHEYEGSHVEARSQHWVHEKSSILFDC